MQFKINFQLHELDKIIPWGYNNDHMHWFGLTDGLLWINAGDDVIYEYSQAARDHWKDDIKYNDYQLARFLEDFTGIFQFVRESVPKALYDIVGDFDELTFNWKNKHIDEPDELFEKFYDEEYIPLTEWFQKRVFDSGHLTGGPNIGCFRHEDKLKLYWESDYTLENGHSIWTSPKGVIEMNYDDFITETERSIDSFFIDMDKQVELAVLKDWGKVEIDKERVITENVERKAAFKKEISSLRHKTDKPTDWDKVEFLYKKMMKELNQ